MANVGYATLQIIPSMKGVQAAVTSQLSGVNATSAGRQVGGSFAAGLKGMIGPAVAALGVGAAIKIGGDLVAAAEESAKVTSQTDAVLSSMGNVAGVTADQVAGLSEKLSLMSGVDDELIQSSQNVLLTFGKVRNEAGKGNDIFDRASESALNMSVALGTDLQSATTMVGKALNDPIKGITAMTRAGIQFTEQQKDQIQTLVDSGDTLGAQKIIMQELDRQFGGSAAAQATASDKLKVAWGNIQEDLGAKLLPIVEKVSLWLAEKLPVALAFFERASSTVAASVQRYWPQIQNAITAAVETVQAVVGPILATVQVLWENFGDNILTFVRRSWPPIQQIIGGVMQTVQGIIQTVTSLIQGDWSGAWEGIKNVFFGVWETIQGIVKTAFERVRFIIGLGVEALGAVFSGAWDLIVETVRGLPGRVAAAADGLWDSITDGFRSAINGVIRMWNNFKIEFKGYDIPGPGPNIPGFTLDTPNINEFDRGGIVPGAIGSPQLILAHGGETVLPTHKAHYQGSPIAGGGGGDITIQVIERPGENSAITATRELRRLQTLAAS